MAKTKGRKVRKSGAEAQAASVAGTYTYSKELGRVIKVSDRIPGIASRASVGSDVSEDAGPCGRSECAGGSCAMPEE